MKFYRKDRGLMASKWSGEDNSMVKKLSGHPREIKVKTCAKCQFILAEHGWVDSSTGGQIICPGDWVIIEGDEVKVMNEERFRAEYEEVG